MINIENLTLIPSIIIYSYKAEIFVQDIRLDDRFMNSSILFFEIYESNLSISQIEINNKKLLQLIHSQKSNVFLNDCKFMNSDYDNIAYPFLFFESNHNNNKTFEISLTNISFVNNTFSSLAFSVVNESNIKLTQKDIIIIANHKICFLFESLTSSDIIFNGMFYIESNVLGKNIADFF